MDYPNMERDSLFYKEFANHFDYRNKPWTAFVKAASRISQRLDVDIERAVDFLNSDDGGLFVIEMIEFAEAGKIKQDIEYLTDGAIATFRAMAAAPKIWTDLEQQARGREAALA